jgi:hypothetical protein
MPNKLAMIFAFGGLAIAMPSPAANEVEARGPKQSFEVTSTERVNFQPGGAIRVENSYGNLTIEGWDEPEVEVTVTKTTNRFYEPGQKEEANRRFEQIHVATERRSEKEVVISTTYPVRKHLYSPMGRVLIRRPDQLGVAVDYKILVPRDTRLIVHQDHGYVWVNDLTQDIDVSSHAGDMIVMLPDTGSYSIDARTGTGSVSSDLVGRTRNEFLVGSRFAYSAQNPTHRVHLRMGCGSITIKSSPPSGPYGKN